MNVFKWFCIGSFYCFDNLHHHPVVTFLCMHVILQLTLEPDGILRVSILLVTPSVSLRMVFPVRGPGLSSVAEAYRKLVPFKSVSSIRTLSV